jgi:hypothetical protein
MARCRLCGEWAGPDTDVHDHCLIEFQRQMEQPGLSRRLLRRMREAIGLLIALTDRATSRR